MGKDISRNLRISQTDSSMQKIRLKVELYLLELLMYHQLMKNLKLKGKNLKNLWKLYKFAKFPKEAKRRFTSLAFQARDDRKAYKGIYFSVF